MLLKSAWKSASAKRSIVCGVGFIGLRRILKPSAALAEGRESAQGGSCGFYSGGEKMKAKFFPSNFSAARIWTGYSKPKHRENGEKPYIFDEKNNVGTRSICKRCKFRRRYEPGRYMCTCFPDTGVMRDKNATDKHCETFKKK